VTTLRVNGWLAGGSSSSRVLDHLSAPRRSEDEDGEGGGGAPGEDGVPDAGGVGAARAVLDGVAGTLVSSPFFFAPSSMHATSPHFRVGAPSVLRRTRMDAALF
jgi:hypothetical protein